MSFFLPSGEDEVTENRKQQAAFTHSAWAGSKPGFAGRGGISDGSTAVSPAANEDSVSPGIPGKCDILPLGLPSAKPASLWLYCVPPRDALGYTPHAQPREHY